MKDIKVTKREIVSEVTFKNGDVLEVGDEFDGGIIIELEVNEDGVFVMLEDGGEGWGVLLNEDGEMIEED